MKLTYRSVRARVARAGLHRPVAWLRHFGLDTNDVVLASHGRSGSTLLRFILGEILSGVPATFDNIQRIVPEIGLQYHASQIVPGGGRLIKSHEPYRREYRRAIYIVRDVRDAMISFFARETAADCIHTTLDGYIRPFMRGKMSHYGSWQAHVDGWLNSPAAAKGNLLLLRFEDMRKNLEGSVALCLEFLGKPVDRSVIQAAIRNNSLERMRVKEDQAKKLPKVAGEEGRQVGKGLIEGWRQKLTEQQLAIVDEYAGPTLACLGYPTGFSAYSSERSQAAPIRQSDFADFANVGVRHAKSSIAGGLVEIAGLKRDLRLRIGGQIANLFCWYHY
jgi:Sulfotransferase domain